MLYGRFTLSCHRLHFDVSDFTRLLDTGQGGRLNLSMFGTSLVAQWLGVHLPVQWTRVRALVREDPTCRGATKPVHHNY